MPVKQYINSKAYNTAKNIGRGLVLPLVLLAILTLLLGLQGKAAEQSITHEQGNSVVVYSATDNNSISITQGTITATVGQSIRLLPGTHIGGNDKLSINIADKACQDAVAQEAKKESEAQMVETVVRRKQQTNNFMPISGIWLFCNAPLLPAQNGKVQSAHYCSLAITTPTQSNITPQVSNLLQQNNISIIHQLSVYTIKVHYASRSWGEIPETIKVLRC